MMSTRSSRRAFTFIEMMVVLVVLSILMGIILFIGRSVIENGRQRQTQFILRTLDQSLTSYQNDNPGSFPSVFTDANARSYPLFDGRLGTSVAPFSTPPFPSLALYLQIVKRNPGIDKMIGGIDSTLIAPVDFAATAPGLPVPQEVTDAIAGTKRDISLFTVLDGWGNPIRFVHNSFDGGYGDVYRPKQTTLAAAGTFESVTRDQLQFQFNGGPINLRRSAQPFTGLDPAYTTAWIGDADEGICVGERPYFYSCGRDLNPGTRGDNLYSIQPNFAAESVKVGN